MVNIRQRSHFEVSKLRLATSSFLLRALLVGVILIHCVVLLWKTTSNNDSDGSVDLDVGLPRGKAGKAPVIPFVVSVTNCGEDPFVEGAAVLKYSIHLASIHGNLNGKYDYKMYAIYHPDAAECAKSLEDLGYELVERQTPVKVEEIAGDYLRDRIEKNGCCGAKELIKLEAYTFTQYPVVVHLDLDVLIFKPLDSLFDAMMLNERGDISKYLMWPNKTLPEKVNAFVTRDFGMVKYGRKIFPVQGGFLVLRPSMDVYHELVNIVKKGDFEEKKGWGGVTGLFYGSMTIQGLLPYYYDVLHEGEAVDLNRCIYNQMCDNPRGGPKLKCNTGQEECEDCRLSPVEDLASAHFTVCLKPWHCVAHHKDDIEHWLCRKIHHEWFRIRSGLEDNWGRNSTGPGRWFEDQFYGFCTRHGKKGYQPISRPFLPSFT